MCMRLADDVKLWLRIVLANPPYVGGQIWWQAMQKELAIYDVSTDFLWPLFNIFYFTFQDMKESTFIGLYHYFVRTGH